MSTPQIKFQQLLRELFQFDCADLDFGIYRIMNFKRAIIERFISEDLPRLVNDELNKGALAAQSQAMQELDAARKKVLEALGEDALDADGNLAEKYRETKAGREYLVAQERARSAKGREALETAIYNHLYSFFSRYWQDGDFISKRRYSKKERYAIPYNGEEVYLYWVNHDQYYVKTGEYFTDYTWKAPHGVTVHFKLKTADVEQNNIKGEKRFFLPRLDEITWDANASTLNIPFEFRPLTQEEQNTYGQRNQQEAIIVEALGKIPKHLPKNAYEALAALIAEKRRTDGTAITLLEHHLRQYTRRNTSDFFIHKDLKSFLSRELDFYLKNEVLNLEEMEAAGEGLAESWFQLMRLIKRIGLIIIEFLAQIENFQKMLWEKKKFITETFYVITVGNISETFYPEIAENAAQWEEWEKFLAIDTLPQDLFSGNWGTPEWRMVFLKTHPSLPLDTRHFSQDFVDRLLASFDDLDEMTDGLLVHSENWQALNLLKEKYRERVKTIYIDPPYNTGATPILYKNDYKHSSWISLMADRCTLSSVFLGNAGILAAAIDDEEVSGLRYLLSMIFEQELGIAVVRSNPAGRKTKGKLAPAYEYLLLYGKTTEATPSYLDVTDERLKRFPLQDEYGNYAWANFIRSGSHDKREDRPKLFYPIFVSQNGHIRVPAIEWNEEKRSYDLLERPLPGEQVVYPVVRQSGKIVEKRWQRGHERVKRELDRGWYRVRKQEDGSLSIDFKTYMDEQSLPTTWWDDKEYASSNYGALELKSLFGEQPFDFSKSTALVRDSILASGGRIEDSIILDYFAGSGTTGHAVINLNREDGGRRKFILVEMAAYFDTVLLPRLKKVTFSPEWKDGKPKRVATAEEAERGPRIIKVIRLESYEDALNNLLPSEESGAQVAMRFEDYLLKYMLLWETRKSETLLNVEKLGKPFDYCLHIYRDGETRVQKVDLPETFNYLIGLDVAKRKVLDDNGRYYLVYRGTTREGKSTVVIWRETSGWTEEDYKRDRDFVAKHKFTEGADVIYVNGDSLIPGAQALEGVFKAKMFAGVEG
jgi:adenine-specific DNA-methyltransferase